MNFVRRHKILTTLAVVIGLLIGLPLFWWTSASIRGASMARIDVFRGHYEILDYGLPPSTYDESASLLRERYGVESRRVAGCIVSPVLVLYADSYNEVVVGAANRKFGHDIFKETSDEPLTNHRRAAGSLPPRP